MWWWWYGHTVGTDARYQVSQPAQSQSGAGIGSGWGTHVASWPHGLASPRPPARPGLQASTRLVIRSALQC